MVDLNHTGQTGFWLLSTGSFQPITIKALTNFHKEEHCLIIYIAVQDNISNTLSIYRWINYISQMHARARKRDFYPNKGMSFHRTLKRRSSFFCLALENGVSFLYNRRRQIIRTSKSPFNISVTLPLTNIHL